MNDIELLDNEKLTNHQSDLTFSNGWSFSFNVRLLSVVFFFIGIVMIGSGGPGYVIGPPLILGAGFLFSSRYGTQVCYSTGYIREYHEYFGIKTGKWVSTVMLPDICILKIGKSKTHSDITGAVSTTLDASKNEVYLMSSNHRKRMLICVCKSLEEAAKVSETLAQNLGKNLAQFNPQISKQTMERKRRSRI